DEVVASECSRCSSGSFLSFMSMPVRAKTALSALLGGESRLSVFPVPILRRRPAERSGQRRSTRLLRPASRRTYQVQMRTMPRTVWSRESDRSCPIRCHVPAWPVESGCCSCDARSGVQFEFLRFFQGSDSLGQFNALAHLHAHL